MFIKVASNRSLAIATTYYRYETFNVKDVWCPKTKIRLKRKVWFAFGFPALNPKQTNIPEDFNNFLQHFSCNLASDPCDKNIKIIVPVINCCCWHSIISTSKFGWHWRTQMFMTEFPFKLLSIVEEFVIHASYANRQSFRKSRSGINKLRPTILHFFEYSMCKISCISQKTVAMTLPVDRPTWVFFDFDSPIEVHRLDCILIWWYSLKLPCFADGYKTAQKSFLLRLNIT